jgi:hypothetical protein
MTSSLDRRLENSYFAPHIETTESVIEISFDSTWISNLSTNKKIVIRRIAVDVYPDGGYPFIFK